ncbi:MAG: AAA family ATPase [Candidatus Eremiobacteraeota bacterium]|nr:AAA family ATPase [Candidatus Eremiobacteraeota bacterium]
MISGPVFCSVLIGRTEELRELVARRLAAARGRGCCVLLSGDAGMGKTRLVSAFRETLTGGRAALGIGLSREFGNAPYGPVLEALQGVGAVSKLPHEMSREEQFSALAESITAACRRRHVVLAIEDAQWADEGSLQFLLYLLPMLASLRLLLIVTHRSDDLGNARPLRALLPRFHRAATVYRISLAPLRTSQVHRLVTLALGDRAPLAAQTTAEIVERCEGNPFFAEELLKNALERRALNRTAMDLPATIRAAVLERCAALDSTSQTVLARAAVLGRRFDAALLAAICEMSLPEVLAALRRLRDFQIVEELPGAPAAYAFRHTLTRDAVYGTMLRDEVRPLHAGILEALEQSGGSAFDLGYHAWAANDGPKSLRYNELAGDESLAVHAYADARICFERALIGAADAAVRGRLLERAADAAARDGNAQLAASLYQRAAAEFERTHDKKRVANLYLAMSSQARHTGDTLESRTILHRAIARLPDDAAAERAMLQLTLAFTHLDRCESDVASQLIAKADAVKESATYCSAVNYCAAVCGDLPAVRAAAVLYTRRCAAESAQAALRARFNVGFTLCVLGLDRDALDSLEMLLPEVTERRLRSLEILTCANIALLYARGGRLEDARTSVERALAIPEPTTTGPVALAAAGLTIACALRDDDLAMRCATPEIIAQGFSSRINSTLGRVAGPYARWRHACGDASEAGASIAAAMNLIAGPFGATETLLAAAELGDATTALQAFAYLPQLDAMASLSIYSATGEHLRALDAQRSGDATAAAEHAAQAAAHYRALGWPIHLMQMHALAEGSSAAATPIAPAPAPKTAALSAREREVATLVAQGIPNRNLAQRLSVSQRTIEKHLTSIFGKLGLRNRAELAAMMARQPPP